MDPDYDRVAAGTLPSLQEVLPKIAMIGEFPLFLFPSFDAMIFGLLAFSGEMLFYLWLLIKGVNVEEWKKRALESAS